MGLFSKKRAASPPPQIRRAETYPFHSLKRAFPSENEQMKLYWAIREAVPIIDAAIMKLVRLSGGLKVRAESEYAENRIAEFLRRVPAGRGQRGFSAFLDAYIDTLITCGRAVGEIVANPNDGVRALLNADPRSVHLAEGKTPLEFELHGKDAYGGTYPLKNQELILFTSLNPSPENPYGSSILRSMPFYCDVLLKIYNTIGLNWERAGNIRYSVTYKPKSDLTDLKNARERAEIIASEWQSAMHATRSGQVKDFVAVGDVDIRVIGAEGQILDSTVPVRQILEQIVARTGIPPFMLGLSWSSTERMSSQQADMLTSELQAIRRTVEPAIERIVENFLRFEGIRSGFSVEWDPINLQDEEGEARARLLNAQASKLENELVSGAGFAPDGL